MAIPIKDNEYLILKDSGFYKVKATGNFVRIPIKNLFTKDTLQDLFEFERSDGIFFYVEEFFPLLPIKNFYN